MSCTGHAAHTALRSCTGHTAHSTLVSCTGHTAHATLRSYTAHAVHVTLLVLTFSIFVQPRCILFFNLKWSEISVKNKKKSLSVILIENHKKFVFYVNWDDKIKNRILSSPAHCFFFPFCSNTLKSFLFVVNKHKQLLVYIVESSQCHIWQ